MLWARLAAGRGGWPATENTVRHHHGDGRGRRGAVGRGGGARARRAGAVARQGGGGVAGPVLVASGTVWVQSLLLLPAVAEPNPNHLLLHVERVRHEADLLAGRLWILVKSPFQSDPSKEVISKDQMHILKSFKNCLRNHLDRPNCPSQPTTQQISWLHT